MWKWHEGLLVFDSLKPANRCRNNDFSANVAITFICLYYGEGKAISFYLLSSFHFFILSFHFSFSSFTFKLSHPGVRIHRIDILDFE